MHDFRDFFFPAKWGGFKKEVALKLRLEIGQFSKEEHEG